MDSNKKIITAAGGLILNEEEKVLMIYRLGKWDLPKGKLEEDESIEECAVREVQEECGLGVIYTGRFLCKTTHYYELKGTEVEKQTHWYLMLAPSKQTLKPQIEEDIEKVGWFSLKECKKHLQDSYPTIKEVFIAFDKGFK